jgi:hypothetical protein
MRRFTVLACLSALVLAAGAPAAPEAAADGTLSVRDAVGSIVLDIRGTVIGRFDKGSISVTDPIDEDGPGPLVRGAERKKFVNAATTTYTGNFLRFRLIGGRYIVRLKGVTDADLSVVGRGTVYLDGDLVGDNGEYAFNDAEYQPMPFSKQKFVLSADTAD